MAAVKNGREYLSHVTESLKHRIAQLDESPTQFDLLIAGIDLMEKCLLVIKILISVLVHLFIVFPVVLMHTFDFFLSGLYGFTVFRKGGFLL